MSLHVGLSRVDITPPIGVELAGFGPYIRRRSTKVRSRIYARAIAVEKDDRRWVLVSAELLGLSKPSVDEVIDIVARQTAWRSQDVVVHLTHNHSGPGTIVESNGWGQPDYLYLAQLPSLLARACVAAINDLSAASVSHVEVPIQGFAHNRMLPRRGLTNQLALTDGWTEPETRLIDTTVHVLRIERSATMVGFLAYYSCHPVICCEQTTEIHGDFPGETLRLLEARYPGATGIFLQGALGDINPLYAHGPPDESVTALELFAGRLADTVERGIGSAEKVDVDDVESARFEVDYSLAPFDISQLRKQRELADVTLQATPPGHVSTEKSMAGVVHNSLSRIIALLEERRTVRRPVYVQALRLGSITMVGFNLEVFHGIKRRLQAALGNRCLVLSTTNGWLGYAPTREAYAPGAEPYPAYIVPVIAGHLPFHEGIEDDLVAAGVAAHTRITKQAPSTH